jgi:hypothetical protein
LKGRTTGRNFAFRPPFSYSAWAKKREFELRTFHV